MHLENISKLPRARLNRKEKEAIVEFRCSIGGPEMRNFWCTASTSGAAKGQQVPTEADCIGRMREFHNQIMQEVLVLRSKLRKTDDFEFDAFLNWLEEVSQRLPQSPEQFRESIRIFNEAHQALVDRAMAWAAAQTAPIAPPVKGDWHRRVKWKQYHPDARTLLNDELFWNKFYDLSPHGNDSGALALANYRRWRKKNGPGESKEYFERQLHQWGVATKQDSPELYYELAIALAFAQIKFDAICPNWIREIALEGLHYWRGQIDPRQPELSQELDLLESKLKEFG